MNNPPVTLAEAKEHLQVTHDLQDAYIDSLIPVAYYLVEDYIDRPLTDDICLNDDGIIKEPLIQAMKLVIGDLYTNRETLQIYQLYSNIAFERLVAKYCKMGV